MPDNRKPLIYGAFPVCRNYTVRAHIRDLGTAKRRRCKNSIFNARSLRRRIHPPHLHPRHKADAAKGRGENGQLHGADSLSPTGNQSTGKEAISSPVLFHPFRAFSRVGHDVGQAVDPHFDPHLFQRFCNKKASKTEVFDAFWSCWADSNCRPHPYQGCALPTELQQQMATRKGFEPSTSGVTGRRSNQLNYLAIY